MMSAILSAPKISRAWAMPSRSTFSIKPIRELVSRYLTGEWLDPFVGDSPFAAACVATNDLHPGKGTHCLEASAFFARFSGQEFDGVLFDPPYSPRQIAECYRHVGRRVHQEDTQTSFYGSRKSQAASMIRTGGFAICCGWNSNGFGQSRGFQLVEMLVVSHGSAHNDTIVTVEQKAPPALEALVEPA